MTLLKALLRIHTKWQQIWPFRGQYAVRHVVAYAARHNLLKPSWFQVQNEFSMYLDPTDYLQRRILCEGVWEQAETNCIRSVLRAGDVFIDVGANIGYFTLLAATLVGKTGTILSIEPNHTAAQRLRQHLDRNGFPNVLVEEVACSDSNREELLHLNELSNCGASSLSSRNATGREIKVKCATVDELVKKYKFPQVSLVKIDVEGAELQVLRGMAFTLMRLRPVLLIELEPVLLKGFDVTPGDVMAYLDTMGYIPSPINASKNCLFSPSTKYSGA